MLRPPPTRATQACRSARGATTRIAAQNFSTTSFNINVNLTDGNAHQVALYLLDFADRAESITIKDAISGAALDPKTTPTSKTAFGPSATLEATSSSGSPRVGLMPLPAVSSSTDESFQQVARLPEKDHFEWSDSRVTDRPETWVTIPCENRH